MSGTLYVTGDDAVDGLVNSDFDALLFGMLLDQQIPMERAFAGPATLRERLGHLDPARIAAMDRDEFVAVCAEKPAIHRFPSSMGGRLHELSLALVEHHGGHAERLWSDGADAATVRGRLRALPGFGEEKTKIFLALLAKRMGVRPRGWEQAAGAFADDTPRSIADVDGPDTLQQVREFKQAKKAARH